MISKILVNIDHKASSQHALIQASILARSEKSQLVLQSVVPPYDGDLRIMGRSEVLNDMKVPYQDALIKAETTAKAYDLKLKSVLDEGEPFAQILDLAEKERVDLIVMNMDRSNPAQHIPIGEITSKVISSSDKDVLVVPENAELRFEKMLLAYDKSEASQTALMKATDLSLCYGSELTITTAYEVPLEAFSYAPDIWDDEIKKASQLLQKAKKFAEEKGVRRLNTVLKHGKAAKEICTLARSIGAGLIVVGCKKIGSMKKMLQGNVVEKVVHNGDIPVWVSKC